MYCRCGCVEAALEVFRRVLSKDVVLWNVMIGGLAMHGHGRLAVDLFALMKETTTTLNEFTYIAAMFAQTVHIVLVVEPQVTSLCIEAQECMVSGRWAELASLMLTSAELITSKVSEKGTMQGKNQSKQPVKYCKPGSMVHYLRMKKRKHVNDELLEILEPRLDEQRQDLEFVDVEQNLHVAVEDDVNLLQDDSEDLVPEEEELTNLEEDQHEKSLPGIVKGKETNSETEKAIEEKNCRGRTMMKEIHSRKFEHRVAIMLNEYNQPIGPDKAVVNQFSCFLGTLARIPSLCRIDCADWRLLKTKEKMWSYAQKKWIIPDEGKKWVLATINGSWRRYKTIIKQKFYKPYNNDKERLMNRPKSIPEEQFKGFIEMVGSKQYKKLARRNKRCRKKQKNMHTTGRTSFACIRNELVRYFVIQEFRGRVRLVGKGVTKSDLKTSSSSTGTLVDGITVKVPVDLVKSITARVKDELTQEILSTVLINLQRVIPNLDSDSILAGLAAGIQSPGDAISGHGLRNASSSSYVPFDLNKFPGDEIPIIRGSSLSALNGTNDEFGRQAVLNLMDVVDGYISDSITQLDKPFLMPIEDVFSIQAQHNDGQPAREKYHKLAPERKTAHGKAEMEDATNEQVRICT
ncbi:hypothetical protein KSP39_PZI016822 [Platanthera zijinensis]|uniref:Pentatricopeptide repeat-containing protein n=1 Tax=Platanthera zijinensis TaxID=2320716 RepID=A0AAP0B661_9ASPA